jgi:hypothetical protein
MINTTTFTHKPVNPLFTHQLVFTNKGSCVDKINVSSMNIVVLHRRVSHSIVHVQSL